MLVGHFPHPLQRLEGEHLPAGRVVGVLHADQRGPRIMDVRRPDGRLQVLGPDPPQLAGNGTGHEAAHDGEAADLVHVDVAAGLEDDLVAPLGVG